MQTRLAYSKITPYLHIIAPPHHGFHEVETLATFLEVHDTVSVARSHRTNIVFNGEFSASIEDRSRTSVHQALAFLAQIGFDIPLSVEVTKNIPVASGLGGGSSDAIAVILSVLDLLQIPSPAFQIPSAVSFLGVDAAKFLHGQTAIFRRSGDKVLKDVQLPPVSILLINPRKPLLTKAVWSKYKFNSPVPSEDFPSIIGYSHLIQVLSQRRNDLTDTASRIVPEIRYM
jgi:4-diphosphocytidyl-2-C-methyl-D-erythritol kinase